MRQFLRQLPRTQWPLLSACLLLLANMAFGFFLHTEYSTASAAWILAAVYIVLECSVLSVAWVPARNFILLGFQSDVGYGLMAVAGASFAVIVVTWIQISTYFLMMLSAALLLRIKIYTRRGGPIVSFLVMLAASFAGLAISWLPTIAKNQQLPVFRNIFPY